MINKKPFELHIKAIEANDVPKMDGVGKSDPFLTFELNTTHQKWKTKVIDNTTKPSWNEEFHLPISADLSDVLTITLLDFDDVSKNDLISTKVFKVRDFKLGEVHDEIYNFDPAPKVKKGANVRLVFHLDDWKKEPFVSA